MQFQTIKAKPRPTEFEGKFQLILFRNYLKIQISTTKTTHSYKSKNICKIENSLSLKTGKYRQYSTIKIVSRKLSATKMKIFEKWRIYENTRNHSINIQNIIIQGVILRKWLSLLKSHFAGNHVLEAENLGD